MFDSIVGRRACAPYLRLLVFAWMVTPSQMVLADENNSAEAKIHAALGSKTQFEFLETPLQEVIDYLRDLHKIEIQFDRKALEDVGIGTDTPVTRNLKNISLRSALRLMLRDLELTYVVDDEVLLITTPEEAEARVTTRLYPVADLVDIDPETLYSPDDVDFDPLIELIEAIVAPDSWDANGGPGAIDGFEKAGALVVSQTHDVHEQVALLLTALRKLRGTSAGPKVDRAKKEERDKEELVRVYRVTNVKSLAPTAAEKPDNNAEGADAKEDDNAKPLPPDYAAAKRSAEALAELIAKAVAPKSWQKQHVIRAIPGTLTIRQTRRVHREIGKLLKNMNLLDGVTTLSPVSVIATAPDALPASIRLGDTAAHARIRKALGEKTEIELFEMPLQEFFDFIRDQHKIEIQIDAKALEDVGIGTDTPLTVTLKNVSLRSALRLTLRELDLTYVIRDEVLSITTPEEAEVVLVTCLYPVRDLVIEEDDDVGAVYGDLDFDPLIVVIEATVEVDSWDANGGPGVIDGFEISGALVVSQTEEVHEQIEKLLQKLRRTRDSQFKRDKDVKKAAASGAVLQVYRVAIGVEPTVKVPVKTRGAEKIVAAARNVRGQRGGTLVSGGIQRDQRQSALKKLAALPDDGSADRAMQDLVALIQGSIEPKSWHGEEGGVIYTLTGYLVVRHTVKVQRRVRALLLQTGLWQDYHTLGGISGFSGGGLF